MKASEARGIVAKLEKLDSAKDVIAAQERAKVIAATKARAKTAVSGVMREIYALIKKSSHAKKTACSFRMSIYDYSVGHVYLETVLEEIQKRLEKKGYDYRGKVWNSHGSVPGERFEFGDEGPYLDTILTIEITWR